MKSKIRKTENVFEEMKDCEGSGQIFQIKLKKKTKKEQKEWLSKLESESESENESS